MDNASLMSRRLFCSMAPAALPRPAPAAAPVADVVAPKVRPFHLNRITLRSGALKQLTELNRRYLHFLDADRLLHMFRVTAGLASKAEPLGGWERPANELRGHFLGHYLSACALMYASERDEELKKKAAGIVAELARCQQALGNGYLSAFPTEFFDRLKAGKKVWAPWYTLHKIMAGLLDLYSYCGNQQALEVLKGMARWTKSWADALTEEDLERVLRVEFGGMNDVLYNLYAATGEAAWLNLAHRFDHRRLFDPLAERRDELKGLHVNTQIPKIIGAARRYELTGETRYRTIAEYFWRQVTSMRSYSTGGASNFEGWRSDPGKLAGELSANTQECCCTYNMLKLTRHLFAWTADPQCADYYERALFNGILGTMNPETGMTMYYVPLASGFAKVFGGPLDAFWCCTGTGVESFSKLGGSIYFHNGRALYVNLFLASELDWPEKGLHLVQDTNFPEQAGTSLVFKTSRPVPLALHLRIPYWVTHGGSVKLNGRPLEAFASPGSFLALNRTWRNGDKLEVTLPMSLHVHPMPDDDTLQAIMYGPLVLVGELGAGPPDPKTPAPAPGFQASSPDPSAWIKPLTGRPLTFRTTAQAQDVTLVPFYRLFNQRYAVYWRITPRA